MDNSKISYPGFCDAPDPIFWIFADNVPSLVYYSHIPITLIAIFLGLFVLIKNRQGAANISFFFLTLFYTIWVVLDSVFWASNRGDVITFVWSMQILFEPLIYISAAFLIHHLIRGRDLSFSTKTIIGLLYLPVVLLVPTSLMLYGFDTGECLSLEGPMATYYTYGIELLFVIYIILLGIKEYLKQSSRRGEVMVLTLATSILLLTFSAGNIISSFTGRWEIAQIGLFMMPFFLCAFVYSIVKYNTLRIKLISTVSFIFVLIGLNFSLLFITDLDTFRNIGLVTFLFVITSGHLLIKSLNKEIEQRREIENLVSNLEKANTRLRQVDKLKSEFVSIASHQLRSPLTSIRGYASLLREGSYGNLPESMQEPVERIEASAALMAESIEDYLNVSRIESGNMKYEITTFNLAQDVGQIADDLRPEALKNGLLLLFKKSLSSHGDVSADRGKTQQIIHNLLNNALKYTVKGTVTVYVHDDLKKKQISVEIIDTGIGMNNETLNSIFQKFERGDKANTVNVKGTGLGLYVAERMANAMGGDVTAHSEGEGKGSRFVFTLPLPH